MQNEAVYNNYHFSS